MVRPARDSGKIVQIARMRYDQGLSQADIARELDISEATVSRALKQAFADGILEVRVSPAGWRDRQREKQLKERFGLDEAIVVQSRSGHDTARPEVGVTPDLARAAALYLEQQVQHDTVVGVSDGESAAAVAAAAQRARVRGLEVVSLIGGIGAAQLATHSAEITRVLAANLGGTAWQLPAPALVDSADVAALLAESQSLLPVFSRMGSVRVVLMGIGAMSLRASIFRHGTIPSDALPELQAAGAAGSLCGRFFDKHGQAIVSSLDARTLAITLAELRRIPVRLGVAAGTDKVPAIKAALRGELVSVLATDTHTADQLAG